MTVTDFLLPVFVQVLLTFVLLGLMAQERVGSIRRGEVKVEDVALCEPNWTKRGRQYRNCLLNQFELPTLFYVLIAFILITKVGDLLLLVLAWILVLSRIVHAYIFHTTSNIVDQRFMAYGVGLLALMVMWIIFAVKVLTGTEMLPV
jgi:hypothetical protein